MIDTHCLKVVEKNPNMLVPYYIMAAYAYYVEDEPFISDAAYDKINKMLIEKWDVVQHVHKDLIDKDQLDAGTCLIQYPEIIKWAVKDLRKIYA